MIGRTLLALLLLSALLSACAGTLEVGLERTPMPDRAAPATIEALAQREATLAQREATLQAENARLVAALGACQATVCAPPTPTPPDLGRLAYIQGGDIWVKALPGGQPRRLTTDGHNRAPAWSPSGNWIAFRKDWAVLLERDVPCDVPKPSRELCREFVSSPQQQVWLIEPESGDLTPVNQGLSVDGFAWSPVQDRLAYVAVDALQTVNADGTGLARLFTASGTERTTGRIGRFAWRPNGNVIAFEYTLLGPDRSVVAQGIWQVSQDGQQRAQLYASEPAQGSEAALAGWTTGGKSLLFWQDTSRPALSAEGAPLFALSIGSVEPASPVRLSGEPVLLRPGFVAPAPLGTRAGEREAIALVVGAGQPTWANKRIEAAGAFSTTREAAALAPAWSPDGTQLAYVAMPERQGLSLGEPTLRELMLRRIWVASLNGDQPPRQLTANAGYRDEWPLWSADGSHLLFARLDARNRASVWIVPAAGGSTRQVVDELTPAPDPIGVYGLIEWSNLFDWWRGPSE